ncbi:hypothetical protein CASFOL_028654 [Castilleja foliolosa]|uniref:Uncharacterized protein ycf33 n=1 Tax=Castilleja foliolosa TaxID=1961234 RepID=A0ABD3CBU4_9LAMI
MNTVQLHLHFSYSNFSNLSINTPLIIPIRSQSKPIHPSSSSSPSKSSNVARSKTQTKNTTHIDKPLLQAFKSPIFKRYPNLDKFDVISSKGHSRMVILGAMSLGLALFLMGFDDHKALAFGPEGPLMEDFWDNMRRYALYALTVSTGAIYALLEPIVELLKNPISAVLIIVILGGSFYLVTQVVSAMVGLSDFSYEYSY